MDWQGPRPDGIRVTLVPSRRLLNHRRAEAYAAQVGSLIRAGGYDLVIGFNKLPGLDVYYAADPCFQARARTRHWSYRLTGRYRQFVAFEHEVFDAGAGTEILLLSATGQEPFTRCYGTPAERFHLLPPEIAPDRFARGDDGSTRSGLRSELGIGDEQKLVLLIGSGFKTKGLDRALLALAALPQPLRGNTRLIAIGQDNPRAFLRLAKRVRVADRFRVLEGRDDIPRFLFAADLLIHPAYAENTGTVLLEAMAAGLPVLATSVCGYASHVAQAGAGELLPEPFRQDHLDRLLAQMLTSPARPAWRENGIAYAKSLAALDRARAAVDVIEAKAMCKRAATSSC